MATNQTDDVSEERLLADLRAAADHEQAARDLVVKAKGRVGELLDQIAQRRKMPDAAKVLGMSDVGAWKRLQSWRRQNGVG